MNIVIVGCGRVGAELASSLDARTAAVTVIDPNPRAFQRLDTTFRGRTVEGVGFDRDVLLRAGIESADGFAAVTSSDNVNLVAARIARDVFNVPRVVARVYNTEHTVMFQRLGLQTVTSSSWGAQRMEHLLTHPGLTSVCTAGNGEVTIVEVRVPDGWIGRTVESVTLPGEALPSALVRGGVASLPNPQTTFMEDDLLVFSVLTSAMARVEELLAAGKEKG